jgi:predicted metal-dependent phosphoesterase TrpH
MRADLHIHTIASDGCWEPERVVAEVRARSIGLFAVTDHDTIDSVAPAEALAREAGLAFLRGVEVSTQVNGIFFHILAYGFEPHHPMLAALLHKSRAELNRANEESVRGLIAAGYSLDLDDYLAYDYERTRGGWKSLNFLVDRGVCKDIDDYFRNPDISLPSTLCSFPHPAEAIAAIKEASGVPVLAHPGATLRDVGVNVETLRPLLDFGIAGVECYHRYNDESTTRFCLHWCARHNLITTVGSDCHGGLVDRELGFPPTDTADLRLGELEERIIR